MTRELHCLRYGEQEIQYEIVRRPRKTLEIAVEPDASVVIAAPEDATLDAIEAKLRKRAAWVTRQQRYFSQFLPRTPERRFVAGETHLYLGRQYRLKVVPHVQESVKLIRGYIVVQTHRPTRPEVTRELVEAWYRDRAHIKFPERIELCLGHFPNPRGIPAERSHCAPDPAKMGIHVTGRTLATQSASGSSPSRCHRLRDHSRTLPRGRASSRGKVLRTSRYKVMPDWERRKQRLERAMA